jgi:hypothetical protein
VSQPTSAPHACFAEGVCILPPSARPEKTLVTRSRHRPEEQSPIAQETIVEIGLITDQECLRQPDLAIDDDASRS